MIFTLYSSMLDNQPRKFTLEHKTGPCFHFRKKTNHKPDHFSTRRREAASKVSDNLDTTRHMEIFFSFSVFTLVSGKR